MKKTILALTILAGIATDSQAQIEKGKLMVGGSVSYESNKSDVSGSMSNSRFAIRPNLGYFISNNMMIGIGVGFTSEKVIGSSLNRALEAAPFGRYYFPLSNKFTFFGQAQIPMAFGTIKDVDGTGKLGAISGSYTLLGVNILPGFAYFPSNKIGVEFSLNGLSYNHIRENDKDGNQVKGASGGSMFSFGIDFFAPRVGIQFYF